MFKRQSKTITKNFVSKGFCEETATPGKITASTLYGTRMERLSPFGGLLDLIKFLGLLRFGEVLTKRG